MSRTEDGCILVPIMLLVYAVKIILALAAYAFAGTMSLLTLIYLPLIIIVALFKQDSEMVFTSFAMWFMLAHSFVEKLFGNDKT